MGLTITHGQRAAFRRGVAGDLEARALGHVQQHLPGWSADRGAGLVELVRRCIAVGRRHGLASDAAVIFYVCIGLVFGEQLEGDSSGALRRALEEPGCDESARVAAMKAIVDGFVASPDLGG